LKQWVQHRDVGPANDARHRRDIAEKNEIELLVEDYVHRVGCADQKQRIAVSSRAHDRLSANIAASTRPVFDNEWLTEALRQPLAHQARDDLQ
jgi:hypothetical protein